MAGARGKDEILICKQYLVSGRVQGVWFRGSTRDKALALGLTGYAKNLPDGRVEVVAAGPAGGLESLAGFLNSGPAHARVDQVEERIIEAQTFSGFIVM